MSLVPQAEALLNRMAKMNVPATHTLSVARAREGYKAVFGQLASQPESVSRVENLTVPTSNGQVPVRVYTPQTATGEMLPIVMFFHGGGFVMGDLDLYDTSCRKLANKAKSLVVAVDYRLAPEHAFPAAPEDCYAATAWVAEHAEQLGGDASRLAVMGDSAGGTLAAVVALMARDRGTPVVMQQILLYPNTDATMSTESMRENAEVGPLVREDFVWFYNHYLPSADDRTNPYASPLHASDVSGLPLAFIVTGEFDPLRDEGDAYVQRLKEAGVPVVHKRYDGMVHGFFLTPKTLDAGKEIMEQTAATLRAAFKT